MLYSVGDCFLMMISNSCTKLAIKITKEIVRKKVRLSGTRTQLYRLQAKMVLKVITAVTAKPIPTEAFKFFETPKKIHKPRKLGQYEVVNQDSPDKQRKVFHYPSLPFSCLCLSTRSFQILKPAMMKPISMKAPGGSAIIRAGW